MKSLLRTVLMLALFTSVASANIKVVDQHFDMPSFLGYVPDRFIVVTKAEVPVPDATLKGLNAAHVGVKSLDVLADQFSVAKWQRQFAGSERKSGRVANELARHYKVTITEGSLVQAMDAYRNDPNVERVEPIGIHSMYATPNDTYYSPYQWALNASGDHDIDAPEAWDLETGSTSTIIALLDSGTRYYHPDLGGANASVSNPSASRGNMWINTAELNGSAGVDDDGNGYVDDWIGYDFVTGATSCWSGEDCSTPDNDPRDFNGHGTHTAGIMGMMTNDGYGMAGVAGGWGNGSQAVTGNGVKIMPLRMGYSYNYLGQEYGVVLMDAAAEAFYYAADNGAKIASCSWGSSNSGGIGTAATYFINHGGIICVAAGNDGTQTADYLNGRGDCISVAATDENDNAASFTTYGTWVDICAPGNNIYATYHDHTDPNTIYWASLSGTSMATPMTAATVGLIWSHNPSWTAAQVTTQLYNSSDNIDAYLSSQYIGKMGAGRINAYNAVNTGTPAAPVANFSGSPTSGTEPLTVNFTDLSTGSITSWSWTFGDGGTSSSQSPSHQYTSAGTYTVSLTVTGPGGSDGETKINYITVNPCTNPTAGFVGSPTSGDYPLLVNFTNQSSGATSYSWTFGDGGTSTATNPSHTYTSAGTFTVTLTATNSCGSDQMVRTNYITVTTPPCDPPVADFSGTPTSGTYPLNVTFTDLSTNSPTSWSWTFGDGGTSTAQNPSHSYTAAGTYTVTLTATNSCGSDPETKTGYISVSEPTSDYATLPYSTGFESGSFDSYWFTQSSNSEGRILITTANTPHSGSYHMTMDDNLNGGQYAQNEAWLRLNLSGSGDVELSFWWKEFSDEDHTQDGVFLSDNGGSSFTKVYNLTGGSTTYQNIVLDIDQLASANGLSLSSTFVIKFQQYDNYSISTDGMAFDDISVVSNDVPPVAAFTGTPLSGNFPLNVNFTDQSTGNPTAWSWNFGDGGTSTVPSPSHTYTAAGSYTVTLTVSNAFGSDDEVKVNYVTVTTPPPPTADFSGSPTSGAYPLDVDFTDLSADNPTSWSWTFGDGGTSTAQNPTHTYTTAGTYTVSLTASNAYGSDVETKTNYITVTEPSADQVITFDDFESGLGHYTDGGGDCARYTGGTYAWSGTAAMDIQDNSGTASSFYHTAAYDVSGFGTLEVEFYFIGISMEVNEDFWVQYYDGSTWQTVASFARGVDFNNNTFYVATVTIPSSGYNFPTNARLRFMCDASGNADDVYIDDITWRGLSTVTAVPGVQLIAAANQPVRLIKESSALPTEYALNQNYPNPFNAGTVITYALTEPGNVELVVYNTLGQRVRTLVQGDQPAGIHSIQFDARDESGRNLASGMYFYRLNVNGFIESKKMMLLK